MPKNVLRRALAVAVALGAGALAAPVVLAGGSGAVFTTDAQGLRVNENHFGSPLDVHLNGGPPCNASRRSAHLPDGWYVFRVTDPSGRVDMHAGEPLSERRFRVRARAVVESSDPVDHPVLATACGAVLRVGPFRAGSSTGVYKLWVAPAPAAGKAAGAFRPRVAKTDNFRLDREASPPDGGGDGGGGDGGGGDGGGGDGVYSFGAPAPETGDTGPARPGTRRGPGRGGVPVR